MSDWLLVDAMLGLIAICGLYRIHAERRVHDREVLDAQTRMCKLDLWGAK